MPELLESLSHLEGNPHAWPAVKTGLLMMSVLLIALLVLTGCESNAQQKQVQTPAQQPAAVQAKACVPTAESVDMTYKAFKSKHPYAVCERPMALEGDPDYPVRTRCKLLKVPVENVKSSVTWYGFDAKGRLISINSVFNYRPGLEGSPFETVRQGLLRRCGKPTMMSASDGVWEAHARWEIAGYSTNMLDSPNFNRCEVSVSEDAAWK